MIKHTKSTQIRFKMLPMIKYLPKYKNSLFLSQNEYNPNIGATIKLHETIKTVIALSYFYAKKTNQTENI